MLLSEPGHKGDALVIADDDVDREQVTILAIRNAGFDNPIFIARDSAALISTLTHPEDEAPLPSAILIDSTLLMECGAQLLRCVEELGGPSAELVALVSNDRGRRMIEQRSYPNIHYLKRPLRPEDVRRHFSARAAPNPVVNPQPLWPVAPSLRSSQLSRGA